MSVLDLYLPDDLPIAADWDLGSTLARIVDSMTDEAGPNGDPCAVYVHRLPVFAVVSASVEGLRAVRVQVCAGAGRPGLAPRLEEAVRAYLRPAGSDCPTRVVVSIVTVAVSDDVPGSPDLRGLAASAG